MKNNGIRILIVEDDHQIQTFIDFALSQNGFDTVCASNGSTAISILLSSHIDMILLDMGLPDMDGFEIIKKIREWSEMPIIVVSARDQDKEKVFALDEGADDYLTKPFSLTELMARIRVAVRHMNLSNTVIIQNNYCIGELSMNFEKHLVCKNNEAIHLTPMEYNLLALFFKNSGKVLTTQFLLKEIYGVNYGKDTQALRKLIAGLRRKIEDVPAKPKYILTEIGVGYRLNEE